jgi:hypothetical protein
MLTGWNIEDDAYCLYYYLFRPYTREHVGRDSFVIEGFGNEKKKEKLQCHVGAHNSANN